MNQPNPWGLTPRQCATLEAVIMHGPHKVAARAMGVLPSTVNSHLRSAYQAMGVNNDLHAALKYDRWQRGIAAAQAVREAMTP